MIFTTDMHVSAAAPAMKMPRRLGLWRGHLCLLVEIQAWALRY